MSLIAGLDGAFAGMLAGGQESAFCASGERIDPHGVVHLERGAQLVAGFQAPSFSVQTLAV